MPKKYKATTTRRKYTKVFRGKTIKRRNAKPKKKASTKKHYVGGGLFWTSRLTSAERKKKEEREEKERKREREIIEQSEDIDFLEKILKHYTEKFESRNDELDKMHADIEKYNENNDSKNADMVSSQAVKVLLEGEYYATMIEKINERIKQLS
jgi:hypothetical protein